ncbi:DUF6088 family protein [Parapedobacter tibetensis]|uniref:DUF6088 family protein n=1 Tax=Parapedobacter tibetensis TaxID=2972951 RepID=UPI00214DB12C|nr:DUF6088 family protein [Parapedobacter tibetensis]
MENKRSIVNRIFARITRKKSSVLLREDFVDLGGYDQVGRALRQLVAQGKIVKIGYGLYAKARVSALTGDVLPISPIPVLAKEALDRLGEKVIPTRAELDYEAGRSTQVPTGRLIGVTGRVSRKIGFKDVSIRYERISR